MDTKGTVFFSLRGSVRSPSKFFPACVILSAAIVLASIPPPIAAQQETRSLVFSNNRVSVTEAAGRKHTATYTVALATRPTADVTVTLSLLKDKDAVIVSPATLTFTTENWQQGQTVTVTGVDDNVQNDRYNQRNIGWPRNTNISHAAVGGGYDSITGIKAVTVTDDDIEPTFSVADAEVSEGDSGEVDLNFTVTLSPATVTETRVRYSTANGSATAGEDYTRVNNYSLVFAAGDSSKTVTIKVTGDEIDENNETLTVTLSGQGRENHGNPSDIKLGRTTATGTIKDDDDAPTVTLALSQTSIAEADDSSTSSVQEHQTMVSATLNHPSSEPTTVTVSVDPQAPATSSDYSISENKVLTIAAGQTGSTGTVTITAVDNGIIAADKTVKVKGTASNSLAVNSPTDITLTITEDDSRGLALSSEAVTVTEADGDDQTKTYTVALTSQPTAEVTVSLSSGNDKTATVSPATLTFSAGDWKIGQTVTVTAVDDDIDNTPERTTTISHTASGGDYGAVTGEVAVTVTDDETRGLAISNKFLSVTEADGPGHTTTYTVALMSQPTAEVTVSLSSGNTDAATVSPAALTFTATNWSVPQTVTVTGVDDDIDQEGDFAYRRMFISHAVRGGDYGAVSGSVRVDVFDAEGTPSFYIQDAEVSEGDSGDVNLTFTVLLSPTHSRITGVDWAATKESTDTATPGIDYRANNDGSLGSSLRFGPNVSSQTLTVVVKGDKVDEDDETFSVTLGQTYHFLDGGYKIDDGPNLGRAAATGTIIDDDTRGLAFSSKTVTVPESSGTGRTATYTVALTSQPTAAVTVSLSSGDEDAATISPAKLTFTTANWQSGQTVTVGGVDDDLDNDPDRTTAISHTASGGDYGTVSGEVAVTVTDNDTSGLTFSRDSITVTEADGTSQTATYTVALTSQPTAEVTVSLSSGDEDAATVSPAKLTFTTTNWQSGQAVTVSGVDDDLDNVSDRTTAISHTASGGDYGTVSGEVAIAVTDDDTRGLRISLGSATLTEAAGTKHTATYTVALASRPTAEVTVSLSSEDDKAVTVSSASLVFTTENWKVGQTVTLTAVDDNIQNRVTGLSRLTAIDHTAVGGDYDDVTAFVLTTVEDDEGTPTFSIADAQVIEGDSGEADLIFTVTLSPGAGFRTQVKLNTSEGTATAGEDYTSLDNKIITFESGDTSKTATVKVTGDEIDEVNETLTATLSTKATIGIEFGRDTATGTITDDDDAPTATLALSRSSISESDDSSTSSVEEHQTTVSATLNHPSSVSTTVTVSVEPQAPAKSSDYGISTNKVLTIAAGDTSSTGPVTITAVDNDIDAADKTVKVKGVASNTIGANDPADHPLTIADDDTRGLTISRDSVTVTEASGTGQTATYTVALASEPTAGVTVSLSSGDEDAATVSPATLTFTAANWRSGQTVTVTGVNDDLDNDPDRTTAISHTARGGDYGSVSGEVAVTVTDDDTRGLYLSPGTAKLTEAAGTDHTKSYTVALTSQPTAEVTVSLSSDDEKTVTVSPASLVFTTENWKVGQTVTVEAVDDNVRNHTNLLTRLTEISHTAAGGDYGDVTDSMYITVRDDEGTLTFAIADAQVIEGDSGEADLNFTVTLSPGAAFRSTVNVRTSDGTATAGEDYTSHSSRLVFEPGATSKTVTVKVTGDEVDEANETLTATLSSDAASGIEINLGRDTATGTITDDDTRGVALSREALALTEGGTHETYTLKLLSQPTEEVTINVSGDPSGLVVLQYQGTSSSSAPIPVTFDENDWNRTKTVTVRPISDDDHEDNSGSIVHAVEGYGDLTAADSISVTVTDTSMPAVLFEPRQVSLKEGETATYTVKLATKPSGTVTVTPISDDTGIATVSGALSLNSTNWKSGLTVTVTGAQDEDGATDTTTISHTVAGYHDDVTRAGPLSVTVADDDAALVLTRGVNLSITKDTVVFVWEGLPVTPHQKYRVRLAAQPGGTVTVTPVSQDETRVTVSRPLTFDKTNWATDQIVELKGLFDEDGYGERVKINHTVTGYDAQPVSVNTIVKDYHGHTLVVEPRKLGVHEGKTGTYSVSLRTDPKSTVTVTPGVSNESAASVSGALTFNSTNWSIPQNVTVTAKEDEDHGRKSVTITNEVSGYSGYRKTHPGGWYRWGHENPDVSVVALTTDDARPGIWLYYGFISVFEGSARAPPMVRLAKEPFDTVTVSIGSLDESIATAWPATIEFTKHNWKVYQHVRITGVEDDIVNQRNRKTEIAFTTTGDYADADKELDVTVLDNDSRGLALSRDAVSVTEADGPGHTETYTVALTTRPTAEVTVSLSSADDEAATVSPATLTFAPSNWKVGQTVTVTGVRDYFINDTDRTTEISHTASGGDYGEITGKVAVTVTDDDIRGLALSRDAVTITEAAGPGRTKTYTVALTTRPTAEVTVSLSSGDGSVAAISPATLTFTASNWKVGQTVTVTGVDDDFENDADRTTEISHTASGGDYGEITGKVAVTVTDDDTRGLALSPDAVTVTEVAGPGRTETYTVALTTQPAAEVTVSLSSGNDNTATVSPAALTFTVGNWKNKQTVTVTAIDDDFVNNPERSTTIAHTASGGDYGAVTDEVTVAVTDDDTRGLVLSNKYLSVTEAAGDEHTTTYTVTLASEPTAEVTVSLSSNHTDIATVSPATLTFTTTNWSVPQTVTVTGVDDEVDQEGDSAYRRTYIPHTARGGDYDAVSDSVRVDVFDDEGTPTLYIEDAEVSEGDSGDEVNLMFTVILTPAAENDVLLAWTTTKESDDTATPGVDYKAASGGLRFKRNDAPKTVTVKVTGDKIDEANETLTVTLSRNRTWNGFSHTPGLPPLGRAAAKGTIIDDDDAPSGAILLSVSPSSVAEADDATTATVTARLPGTTTRSADTAITVSVGDSADQATEGTDYETVNDFTLTIPAGESSGTAAFSIDPKQDTIDEGAGETLSISGAINGNVQGLSVTAAQMTITDDDDTPTLTLALSESTISENGGASTVTATLSAASSENVTVSVSADAVSPAVNADFTLSQNKTLTIAAGETSSTGTVTITGVDNSVDAPNKTVTVSGTASGGHGAADPASKTLTITDDDAAPSGAITLSVSPTSVAEADSITTATVTAQLPGTTTRSADTAITVSVGDAADGATEGTDYATVSDLTLTIAAGASSGTAEFSIDPTQDTIDEGAGETLSISGTTTVSGLSVTGTQMTITDDDAPTVTLQLSNSSISENGGESAVTATLSAVSSETVTVTVSAAPVDPAVDSDFTLSQNKTLTIAAGETSSTGIVTITGVDNNVAAPFKTVTVSGAASGGEGAADPSSLTLIITNDDAAPSGAIVLSVSPSSVAEADDATAATVTARLPGTTTRSTRRPSRSVGDSAMRPNDRLCDSGGFDADHFGRRIKRHCRVQHESDPGHDRRGCRRDAQHQRRNQWQRSMAERDRHADDHHR